MLFDLQLFSEKASILSPESFEELSVVLEGFAPRNQSARVITVKAAAHTEKKPGFLERFGTFMAKGMWIPDGAKVPDNIDGDGDGPEDYDQIAKLLANTYYDLSASWNLSGDSARTAAIVAAIDTFLANLDDVRMGGDGQVAKAGRKHSAATVAALKDVRAKARDSHQQLDTMIAAMIPDEKAAQVEIDDDPGAEPVEGETLEALELDADAASAETVEPLGDGSRKAAKAGPFADPGYREDKKKRYPIGDADHVRAALSYIGMPKNRSKYSKGDLAKVESRIHAAAKKYGIDVSKAALEEIDPEKVGDVPPESTPAMDTATLKALIAEVVSDTVAKATPVVDLTPIREEIAALGERMATDKAALEAKIVEASEATRAAQTTLAAIVGKASAATATGGDGVANSDGKVADHPATGESVAKAAPRAIPDGLSGLAAAVHAQRVAATV